MQQTVAFCIALLSFLYGVAQTTHTTSNNNNGVFTDPRDGRNYTTVRIGSQIWFAENFAYLPSVDTVHISVYGYKGSSVQEAMETASYKTYGALYSWRMATTLAPPGWHLPTDADWQELEKTIGIHWDSVQTIGWRGNNNEANLLKANGTTGFNVLFGGWRTDYGEFRFQEQHANFWCADSVDNERAIERLLGAKNGRIGKDYGNKGCGFSVRYVRDTPAD